MGNTRDMENETSSVPGKRIFRATDVTNLSLEANSGVYYLLAKINGKGYRESLKTTSKTAAKELLAKRLADIKTAVESGVDVKSGLTVAQCAEAFIQSQRDARDAGNLSPNYVANLEWIFKKFWSLYGLEFGTREIRKVTIADLKTPYVKLWTGGLSATYVNTLRRCLIGVYSTAIERAVLTVNLAENLPHKVKRDKPTAVLTDEQLTLLLDHIVRKGHSNPRKHKTRDFCEFLCWTGARLDEAGNVLVSDLNLDEKNGHANPTLRLRICKGGGGTESRARTVPVIPGAIPLFKRLCADKQPGDPLLEIKKCLRTLKRACAELGLPHCSHHTFRHVFATRALQATNSDYFTVAGWLGHTDGGKLLAKRYAHLQQEHSQAQAKKISFSFTKAEPVPAVKTVEINGQVFTMDQLSALVAKAA